MTPLEEVVVAALGVLGDLDEQRGTADGARRELAALGARHGLRLRLVEDEESFDGSVHHDVIVRGAGRPTVSLSVSSGPGLPWPLRGVARPREYDLVEVNFEKVSVAEGMLCLDALFDDVRLMRAVVDSALVGEEIERCGLMLTATELQEATDAYRRAHRLYTAEATAAWLAENGLTPDLLAKLVEQHASVAKLRRHAVGPGVQQWLADHAADLEVIVVAWATGGAARLRADPVAAVTAAWREGGRGGLEQWRVGELPAGFAALRNAAVGDVVALDLDGDLDGGAAFALVVDRRAELPQARVAAAERQLFADWLAERRAAARVTWFWGDRRATDRVDDAPR